ncbi:MAG: flagellar biosynthesis anti-sigma factor FlgM [Sideroxydans sp.]|nr:flagellar biosynthesis anti-sigma factor FlgM [Sideroxydans sp.]
MKIGKTSKPLPPAASETSSRGAAAKAGNGKSSPAQADSTSVHLGSTTAQLRSMESSLASTPIVDAKKVSEIKQAISDGRFQVNSGVVADKLISSVRELISAGGR